mgnify:CR=1 FL=1
MVAHISLKKTNPQDLHLAILPAATRQAFLYSKAQPLFSKSGWYLAGGTALALQLQHRLSFDLDFFSTEKFDQKLIN